MVEKQASGTVLTEHELSEIRAFVERRSGIVFDSSRERFFSTRVREHLEQKRLAHGTDLMRLIRGSNAEYDLLLERMLTQETSFFRYPDVFEALEKRVLPEMHTQKFWENPRTLRIWSAGCSTGEEPYSIAMTVLETLEFADAWNIHILATDISRHALEIAERGVYSRRDVDGFGLQYLENHFVRMPENPEQYQVRPRIRNMVTFAPMNLAQMVYMGRFDCIFCMNVLIYFSEELRASLIQRFADYLQPGGYLFLGHAESAAKAKAELEPIVHGDSLIYQKVSATRRVSAGQV